MRKYEITRTIRFIEVSFQALDKEQGIVVEGKTKLSTSARKDEDLLKLLSTKDANLVPFKILHVEEHKESYGMSLETFINNAVVLK